LKPLSDQPYSTARNFFISGAFWGIVGALYGLIASIELFAPDLYTNIEWLTFGRLRPIHVNVVAFGFVYSLLLGGASYIVPRLCGLRKLWSERLGNLSMWLWNAVFVSAAVTLHTGMTQGRELAELVYFIDVLFMLSIGLFTVNVFMTIANRKQRLLYVSLWYIAGGLVWTLSVYFLGNIMFRPPAGALTGIVDPIWLWFYGHNVVGLIITPIAVALIYWVVPRAVRAPVWSHTMSLIGFWVLLVMYTHIGTHHLLQAPVPRWLKIISVVDSIAMVIPVLTVLLNVWLPMRGRWHKLHDDPGAKLVFVGSIFYLLTCIQGPLHSLPSVQRLTHFTHWVVGHSHIAILGFAGFVAVGALYTILPQVLGRPLHSKRLADLVYWLLLFSVLAMFIDLSIAGLVQGAAWLGGEAFYRVVPQLTIYMILRTVSGIGVFSALLVSAYNVLRTLLAPKEQAPLTAATGMEVSG
jgi:cytochrome c oxidase cbb3-type subunit 1